jgi:nucleoside-diphosphate-sugar epimerase
MTHDLHVVLGASGGAGNAIVHALAARGHAVRAVSRGGNAAVPEGVERVSADVTKAQDAASAVRDGDVVYMAAQPSYHRWAQEFPSMLSTVIDAVIAVEARLVMVDNLYMYDPKTQPFTEKSAEIMPTKKGKIRIQLADMLRDSAASRGLMVAIGRASDYYGPGANTSAITALAIDPGLEGKSIKWIGTLNKRHSVAYLPDIAKGFAILGESEKSIGETWILPHGSAPTGAEFLEAVNAALPVRVKTGVVTAPMLAMAAPFHRASRETREIVYQWTDTFVVDDSKFRAAFGPFTTTPFEETIRTTIASYQKQA